VRRKSIAHKTYFGKPVYYSSHWCCVKESDWSSKDVGKNFGVQQFGSVDATYRHCVSINEDKQG